MQKGWNSLSHNKINATRNDDSQGTIKPEQRQHGGTQPRPCPAQAVLFNVEQDSTQGNNDRRSEKTLCRMQKRRLERMLEANKTTSDQNHGKDEQHQVEDKNHAANCVQSSETEGYW